MRQLKRKDLILEHYRQVIKATVIDDVTKMEISVRVWKPKTMDRLPAYDMLKMMYYESIRLNEYRHPEYVYAPKDKGACWVTGNPDYGLWDMQIVKRMDYKKRQVDIYICALLMRPFSDESAKHYQEHLGLDVWDRMLLMWDSRQYDIEGQYQTIHGVKFGGPDSDDRYKSYDDMYRVISESSDIAEGTM